MNNVCELKVFENNKIAFEGEPDRTGKLLPKDGETYQVVIVSDNPDIDSLRTELRLTEQAMKELEKQIGYNIKIWHQGNYPYGFASMDISIDFADSDPFFSNNTLAYAGYPNGSFRGKVVFNNKFIWLDGYPRTLAELTELGLNKPGMINGIQYATFNYRQTVKHELCGHVFGLEHTDGDDVMNAYYAQHRIMFGKESKETLNRKYGTASIGKRLLPDSYIKSVMNRRL